MKKLIKSEQEFLSLWQNEEPSIIEEAFGIEFGYESDGKFPSDLDEDEIDIRSSYDGYNTTIFKRFEHCILPNVFPCVVLINNRIHWDGTDLGYDLDDYCGFVTLSDFEEQN